MDTTFTTSSLLAWIGTNATQLIITVVIIVIYAVLDRFSTPRLEEGVDKGNFKDSVASRAIKIARLFTGFVGFLILAVVWGIDFYSVIIFATTAITLLGVALFASWSLLSNITAYFILIMHPSFRRGTFIRVIDIDNYAEGYISELTAFNTVLLTENREVIVYPNNLLLGRPAVINPRDRLNGVGKLPPFIAESIEKNKQE